MNRRPLQIMFSLLLCACPAWAQDTLNADQIRSVITAVDQAAMNRDASGIGIHLSEHFSKDLELGIRGSKKYTAHVPREAYLDMIREGWEKAEQYSYTRQDTLITIAPDGLSGESRSTILETVVMDGESLVSKVREYARYQLEDGRVLITTVDTHTLAGDTTPE